MTWWDRRAPLIALAFVFVGMITFPSHAETLRGVVNRTLSENPEIAALRANRRAIDEELEAAKGLGLPKLDVEGKAGYIWREQTSGGGLSAFEDDTHRYSLGGTLSVPVYDGFKTRNEVARQTARVQSARFRVQDTASSLALEAIRAYMEVMRAQKIVSIAHQNIIAHRAIMQRVVESRRAGRSTDVDLKQARSRIASAKASHVEARAKLANAKSLYFAVIGSSPKNLKPVSPPFNRLPGSVKEAILKARENAPALIALSFDHEAAEAAIGTAESEFHPKVSVEVSGNTVRNANDAFDDQDDFSAMLVFRKNLYNGGIDRARIEEARHRSEQVYHTRRNARRLLEKEIRLSWVAIRSSRERTTALAQQADLSRGLTSLYASQFRIGNRSLLDLLDIRNEVFVSETALATEQFIAGFNVYRIMAAMGTLVEEMEGALPEEGVTPPAEWRAIIVR
ncbi:MAG: TolC family outer membrane protein [Pseudomonadota bacterium]